jgi:hypothetical protein
MSPTRKRKRSFHKMKDVTVDRRPEVAGVLPHEATKVRYVESWSGA